MQERHLDEELDKVKTDLLTMAAKVEAGIHNSIEALQKQDKDLAQKVITEDHDIDEMENKIEEQIIDLLALFQPMAVDLRFITTGMHINTELERIADLSVNIAHKVIEIADEPLLKPLIDIPKLADQAKRMVKQSLDAFVKRDEGMAKDVILSDVSANQLRNAIIKELVDDFMVQDGATAPRAVPLLLVARDLERICDHASSIAEDVIYMIQAKVVKHHRERLKGAKA